MQLLYKKIEDADFVILASPIFFGSLSAQTKMMIDRYQCLWLAKYIFKTYNSERTKPGAFICVEASKREDFFENARAIVRNFFKTIDVNYEYELFCPGLEQKGSINKHPGLLKKAFELGEDISQI